MGIFEWLFNSRNYMPHGHCYLWQTDTLWLNVGGDALIGTAYMAIPAVLYFFVRSRRHELPFAWIPLLFAAFILLCGGTHFLDIWTVWNPDYRLEGLLKVLTGIVSISTAIALVQIMPLAIRLRTPAQLQLEVAARTKEAENSNALLRQEIATREATETRLRESEERFRLAAEALPGYIYEERPGEGVVERSEGFPQVTGFSTSESPKDISWWASQIHPLDIDDVRSATKSAYDSGAASYSKEYRIQHRSGHYIWIWDHAVIVRDAHGRVTRIVGNVVDISDRKRAEAERQALLESEQVARGEAERANRLKDEFLGTLSHELRTPLSTIQSWAHLLKSFPTNPEQVSQGAEIIERNAGAQAQLISDLLDMSRIVAGKLRLDVQAVDPASVVQAAIDTVRPAADARQIRIQAVLEPILTGVQGDPTRLQQAVWNLLTNAIKFTPKGGRVHVSVASVNSHVEIVVTDSGRGIARDFLPEVFQRFRQADGSTAREHEGLGLGLAIVKQVVELHGGTVRAASEGEGLGSTFTIELPRAAIAQEAGATRAHPRGDFGSSPELPNLGAISVLIVDDQVDAAEGTARLLASVGATVSTADSVDRALELTAAKSFDVIVSDIGMPKRDGFDLVQALRARGDLTPLLALTAFARAEDRARSLLGGFEAHVSKPADPAELIAAIMAIERRTRDRRG